MSMAPPSQISLGKRKRTDDVKNEDEGGLFMTQDRTDQDDDMEETTAYNEAQEEFPQCAAYGSQFEVIKGSVEQLSKEVRSVLSESPCNTPDVTKLRQRAEEVAFVPDAKCRTIGLLADAGAGKSSLVNSLTDIPDLAKALDGGQSCTFVPTLYHKANSIQRQKFSATIEFFDLKTISILLSSSLDDWYLYYFEFDDNWTPEQVQQYQRRATTCLSTFRAIFCQKADFSNQEEAEKTLNLFFNTGVPISEQLELYVSLAAQLLEEKKQPNGNYEEYFETNTQDELREQIDPLLTESVSDEEVTLWPLVKMVSVGVRGSRVLDKFTIADLPGISDTNQVRVRATFDQIDKCDELWVIGRVGRIITDTVVDGLLQRYGRIYRDRIAVIATKSDENIDNALAMDLQQKGYHLGNYAHLKRSSEIMGKDLAKLKKEKAKTRPNSRERARISDEIETRAENQQNDDRGRFTLVVRARNEHVKQSLRQDKHQHFHKGTTLKVFPVSNLHYAAHKGRAETTGWVLDPEATCIPALRHYVLELAAPDVMQTLEDFVMHDFTVVLSGLDLWANQSLTEGRRPLLAIVQKPQDKVSDMIERYLDTMDAQITNKLATPLDKGRANFVWAALVHLDGLKVWHFSTMKAFINKYGLHRTSAMPEQSWNEGFSRSANKLVHDLFPEFQQSQAKLNAKLKEVMIALVESITTELNDHPASVGLPMGVFEDAMIAHIRGIENVFRDTQEDMNTRLRNILSNATVDKETGYFHIAMRECYDTCKYDKGKGVKTRWLATFNAHLTLGEQRSPFAIMTARLRQSILTSANGQARTIQRRVGEILDRIVEQFESMITDKKPDPSEIPVRKSLKAFLETGNAELQAIKAGLERLKRSYGQKVL